MLGSRKKPTDARVGRDRGEASRHSRLAYMLVSEGFMRIVLLMVLLSSSVFAQNPIHSEPGRRPCGCGRRLHSRPGRECNREYSDAGGPVRDSGSFLSSGFIS